MSFLKVVQSFVYIHSSKLRYFGIKVCYLIFSFVIRKNSNLQVGIQNFIQRSNNKIDQG